MAADWVMKAHDLAPSIQAALTSNNQPVDLTGASVKFIMRAADAAFAPTSGTVSVNAAATIVGTATGGVVRYDWIAGDTSTPGNYVAEWQVTFPNGKPETFPTLTYHSVTILADLDGA